MVKQINLMKDFRTIESISQNDVTLYDLVDLEKIFKVTKRTLFNWRAKGIIQLIELGGKLYMTPSMVLDLIHKKGGTF